MFIFPSSQSHTRWPQQRSAGLRERWWVHQTPAIFSAWKSAWRVRNYHRSGVCVVIMRMFFFLYLCCHRQPFQRNFSASQMSTFSGNPHPDDAISGIVCSLLLSDGVSDIKLANLTQMIEVQIYIYDEGNSKTEQRQLSNLAMSCE